MIIYLYNINICNCENNIFGQHTKDEHVDGMYPRCKICGAIGHYKSKHYQ